MLFSVNQASHLYVVNTVLTTGKVTEESAVGTIKVNSDGDNIYFTYKGEGGLLRSDLVAIKDIMDIRAKEASKLDTKFRAATITLNAETSSTIVAGQDYFVRIKYSIGSIDNQYLKYGVVRATKEMVSTPEKFFAAMEESLKKNFAREPEPVFSFTHTSSSLVITEVEPKWVLGTYPQRPVDFKVSVDTIIANGVEGPWGVVTVETPTKLDENNSYPNSKKIADFEYFCMGERGDVYRNYNWPNVIPTKYMIDATDTDGYDVINIHYAYTGSNESVQKSEKDIFLVGKSLETFYNSIKAIIE
jgi:hypothetical protein